VEASAATVARLLGRLYDAATAPELWPEFLQDLRHTASADMSYVLAVDPGHRCDLSIQLGLDESAIAQYQSYYVGKDLILDSFIQAKNEHGDWIGDAESLITKRQLRQSEIFNDFMRKNGVAHHCGATLSGFCSGTEATVAGVCMMRSESGGTFPQETVALLAILAPHVKRAVNLHQTLEAARMESALLRQSVETVDLAILSLDGRGVLLNLTQAAQRILDTRDGLVLGGKRLCALVAAEDRRLLELTTGAASTGAGSRHGRTAYCSTRTAPQAGASALWTPAVGGAMLISRRPPKRPLQLVVTPFHSSNSFLDVRPSALVFLSDPDAIPASRSSIMRTLYGLSPTECRLADMLAAGTELTLAAEHLKITVQTARFHLKAIFQKTGTNRQTDLVRLILGLPGVG
jgi:DNA-binding CsgD family transcriptional regulator